MSIRIIGAGFGRTGTLSLKHALETLLNAPCYHMTEVFENPNNASHIGLWHDAAEGRDVDWTVMLSGYHAIVDWPGCRFYKQLMHAFPQAKVVLTKRNFDSWYQSCLSTIHLISSISLPWLTPMKIKRLFSMAQTVIWSGTFQGRFLDKEFVRSIYEAHITEVIKTVPSDRLLIFEPQQGWKPLCQFLGLPLPSIPFPHLNDANDFQARVQQIRLRTRIARILGYLFFIVGVSFVIYLFHSIWLSFAVLC